MLAVSSFPPPPLTLCSGFFCARLWNSGRPQDSSPTTPRTSLTRCVVCPSFYRLCRSTDSQSFVSVTLAQKWLMNVASDMDAPYTFSVSYGDNEPGVDYDCK